VPGLKSLGTFFMEPFDHSRIFFVLQHDLHPAAGLDLQTVLLRYGPGVVLG
jgi:hypothetical protein